MTKLFFGRAATFLKPRKKHNRGFPDFDIVFSLLQPAPLRYLWPKAAGACGWISNAVVAATVWGIRIAPEQGWDGQGAVC